MNYHVYIGDTFSVNALQLNSLTFNWFNRIEVYTGNMGEYRSVASIKRKGEDKE